MRFTQFFQLSELVLVVAALVVVWGTSNTKVSLSLLTGALGLNIADRTRISRRLETKAIIESERLRTEIEGLSQTVPTLAEKTEVEDEIEQLQTQIKALPPPPKPVDLAAVESEIASLNTRFSPLVELDPARIQNDFSSLREEQEQLNQRLEELPATEELLVGLEQTTDSLTIWAEQIVEHIQTIRPYRSRLIKGRKESRKELIKALRQTEHHLILVNPWLTTEAIDEKVMEMLEEALKKPNVQIDIGWGFWKDVGKGDPYPITRKYFRKLAKPKDPEEEDWKYAALDLLEDLEREHSERFRLKLMGTHEKLMVWDDRFAVVGSHNFLTSSTKQKKVREIGIKTDDPNIIKKLVEEFENATNWEI